MQRSSGPCFTAEQYGLTWGSMGCCAVPRGRAGSPARGCIPGAGTAGGSRDTQCHPLARPGKWFPSENQMLTKQRFIHPNSSALRGKYLHSERGSHKQRGGAGAAVWAGVQTGSRAAVLALRGSDLGPGWTQDRHETPPAPLGAALRCKASPGRGDTGTGLPPPTAAWGQRMARELLGASCCCPR